MAYPPTITTYIDALPCPRVEVSFSTLAPGTAFVTVYRIADGRQFRVRSAVNAPVAGSFARLDFEVPFQTVTAYRAEMFDAAGLSLGFTDSSSVTLDVAVSWMHNPLTPSSAVQVELNYDSASSVIRPTPGDVLYPQGRAVGVLISGQRNGVVDVALTISTDTATAANAVDAMFGVYEARTVPVVCLRTPPLIRVPRTLFAAVLAPAQRPINVHMGGYLTEWDLTATEVSPPAPALIVPLLRRSDINAFYATRTAVNSGNLTRDAVNRRYDLAGTAP